MRNPNATYELDVKRFSSLAARVDAPICEREYYSTMADHARAQLSKRPQLKPRRPYNSSRDDSDTDKKSSDRGSFHDRGFTRVFTL
jgi:hypothetical protein